LTDATSDVLAGAVAGAAAACGTDSGAGAVVACWADALAAVSNAAATIVAKRTLPVILYSRSDTDWG